jgi:hypothetical protein
MGHATFKANLCFSIFLKEKQNAATIIMKYGTPPSGDYFEIMGFRLLQAFTFQAF